MSVFFLNAFQETISSLSPYSNELMAISLFAIGYFLFRAFNLSNEDAKSHKQQTAAKQPQTPTISQKTQTKSKNIPQTIFSYNIYIRDSLSYKPELNPFEVLSQMQQENIIPDITSFNTLLHICFEQKNYEVAMKLFTFMKNNNQGITVQPDIITFNTVLKGLSSRIECANANNEAILRDIKNTKLEMIKYLQPNAITYNTIIDAYVKAVRMNAAYEVFDEMSSKGVNPDIFTYSSLIKGFRSSECMSSNCNSLDKVFQILDEIKQKQLNKTRACAFDETLYYSLIDACFKFNYYNKAVTLFDEMQANGLRPSAITYGIMIRGHGQFKNLDQAINVYEKMQSEKIKINEITFGCLIDACIKCNKLSKALELLGNEKNAKPNTVIYTTILKGFTREKNLEKALAIVDQMNTNPDLSPNIITYNSLLDCAVNCNDFPKIEEIFQNIIEIQSLKADIQPDLITYSTYIKGLCKQKQTDKAYDLYNQIRNERKYTLDEVLYNSLLDGLVKNKDSEKAFQVYQNMISDKIEPSNVTYSILIKLYSNLGDVDNVLSLYQTMKTSLRPGLIVYTCLIQTCIKHKKTEILMELYQEMLNNQINGDAVFYNTLASGLLFNHKIAEASKIVLKTMDINLKLNSEVYHNILRQLCRILEKKKHNYENKDEIEMFLLKLSHGMRKLNVDIEMGLYNKIAALIYRGNVERKQDSQSSQLLTRPHFFNRNKTASPYVSKENSE